MTPAQFTAARTALNLTRSQWADMLGITRQQVHRIEAGTREINGTLARLLAALADGWRPRDV